jgi:exopolysaccharide production protein ExoY
MSATILERSKPRLGTPSPEPLDLRRRRDVQSRRFGRMTIRRQFRSITLMLLDVAALTLAVLVTIRFVNPAPIDRLLPLILVLGLLGQAVARTYGPAPTRRSIERILGGFALALLLAALLDTSFTEVDLGLAGYAVLAFTGGALLCGSRRLLDRVVGLVYGRGIAVERLLVIGGARDMAQVREHFRAASEGVQVVGYITPDGRERGGLGSLDSLSYVLQSQDVDRVVISAGLGPDPLRSVMRECFVHGASVCLVPATLSELKCRVSSKLVLGWPILELEVPRLHLFQVVLKRSLDIIGSTAGLLALSPLLLAVALGIKIASPGPAFFHQRRVGLGGRSFMIIKFRSMRADAEEVLRADPALYRKYVANGCKLSPEEDPRVFSFGSFIRRTSIDELPQLINVLKGDMSLVGPRPILPDQLTEYGSQAPTFLGVRPGLTGYWQVSGRSSVGYPERADLDIDYIVGWSIGMDLKILLRTVPEVLARRGAF